MRNMDSRRLAQECRVREPVIEMIGLASSRIVNSSALAIFTGPVTPPCPSNALWFGIWYVGLVRVCPVYSDDGHLHLFGSTASVGPRSFSTDLGNFVRLDGETVTNASYALGNLSGATSQVSFAGGTA